MLDKIHNILERNQYQVILHTTETGFSIQYPHRIEYPVMESRIEEYFVNDEDIVINGETVIIPKHIQLTYSMSKMVVSCNKMLYNTCLVRYIHQNKDVSADNFWTEVPFNMTETDKKKDIMLRGIINIYLEDAPKALEIAKNHNIENSVKFIVDVLSNKEQK
jgi:hypothetical protein